jgi:uncharacterized membrane protein
MLDIRSENMKKWIKNTFLVLLVLTVMFCIGFTVKTVFHLSMVRFLILILAICLAAIMAGMAYVIYCLSCFVKGTIRLGLHAVNKFASG